MMSKRNRIKGKNSAAEVARNAAKGVGHAVETGGRIAFAAAFGNEAEKTLSLGAHDIRRDIELARQEASTTEAEAPAAPQGGSIPDREIAKLLRATGTAVWKLSQRMLDEETGEPKDDFRRVWRHVEAIRDALSDVGVEIIDWTGKRYDEGMSLKVVSEEERPGAKDAEIAETLLPTLRFRKQIQLQQGEVIVSRPSASPANQPEPQTKED